MRRREKSKWKIACIITIVIALLIAPLIGFGATQNVTEQEQNTTLPIPENTTIPENENVTSLENVTELNFNEIQLQPENITITDITAPIITILSPESTTYNTTAINLNYTIDEPAEWAGYSLNGANNVTIFMGNITFNASVGLNELVVYARDTAGNVGKAGVQFTVDVDVNDTTETITDVIISDGTESLDITPKLSAKKDSFALDEEPAFTFEYNPFIKSVDGKELEEVAAPGEPQRAFKKWMTANETIETFVYDSYGKLTDIEPEIEKIRAGKFSIELPEQRAFRAGLYKLSVELVKEERIYVVEKQFPWGLVSLNTRKSIYKPGETAEFILVVLDKDGHPVSGADTSMTITNPNNEKTVYRTGDDTILPCEECGLYNADYLTEVEGNHTISVTALIGGVEVDFSTHFLVKQDYEFDIIRTAESKIDPTRQDRFVVTIDIESFTDAESVTLKEFVPAEFDVYTADAASVLLEDDTKTITWNKDLINKRTSVSYSYSVPHVWPYLYALGPVEIEYDSRSFIEARPWYVAVDPIDAYYISRPTAHTDPQPIGGTTQANAYDGDWGTSADIDVDAGNPNSLDYHTYSVTGGSGDISNVNVTFNLSSSGLADDKWTLRYSEDAGSTWTDFRAASSDNLARQNLTYTVTENTDGVWTWTEIQNDLQVSIYVDKVTGPDNGYVYLYETWANITYTAPDTEAPSWHDQGQNVSELHKGESINLSARWTDNVNLKNATLAHNGTGTWQNVSTIALNGIEDWSNFTLTTELDWTPGIIGWKIYANDTSDNENVTANMTFELWGYSNVTWSSPPGGSSYTAGETITLTCLVRDANTSSPIANYPVHFYNRTDSTVTHDFGVNYTNSSGYAVMDWDTTGVAAGWYYPMCNITDNATLYYNVSAPYEDNTSIKLYSTTLEIRNQTNVTDSISSINFSGASGDTVSNPYNNVDGSGSPQDIASKTPVVTIYNPSSSTTYQIWLKVTNETGWDNIISDEKFNVTANATEPGDVSTWTSLKPGGAWGTLVDTGETVAPGTHKDLYLAFQLKGSGTGTGTISVLAEV